MSDLGGRSTPSQQEPAIFHPGHQVVLPSLANRQAVSQIFRAIFIFAFVLTRKLKSFMRTLLGVVRSGMAMYVAQIHVQHLTVKVSVNLPSIYAISSFNARKSR